MFNSKNTKQKKKQSDRKKHIGLCINLKNKNIKTISFGKASK